MVEVWQQSEEPSIQKVGYKTITTKHFVLPDGRKADFTTLGSKGANNIATIALTSDKKVIVARQFRPGPEAVLDEIPGGGAEEGEKIDTAAARELLEETGYASEQPLEYLGPACRDSYTNETSNYFLAHSCKLVAEQALDKNEFIDIVLISIDELIENAKNAKMSDSVAVLMAYDRLQEIKNS